MLADRARRFPTLADLPAHPVSATEGLHLAQLPRHLAARVREHTRRIPTPELNAWLKEAQQRRQVPSNAVGRSPRIYYMTQTGVGPPEFALFVNAPSRLTDNYRRYLWSAFAERFGFHGTPLRFRVRKSE
jgi:GTP-binding protein